MVLEEEIEYRLLQDIEEYILWINDKSMRAIKRWDLLRGKWGLILFMTPGDTYNPAWRNYATACPLRNCLPFPPIYLHVVRATCYASMWETFHFDVVRFIWFATKRWRKDRFGISCERMDPGWHGSQLQVNYKPTSKGKKAFRLIYVATLSTSATISSLVLVWRRAFRMSLIITVESLLSWNTVQKRVWNPWRNLKQEVTSPGNTYSTWYSSM